MPLLGVLCMGVFFLIFFIFDDSVEFFKKDVKIIFLGIVLLLWLPFSVGFIWTNALNAIKHLAGGTVDVRWQSLMCEIDSNQRLQGLLCSIAATEQAVRKEVSKGVSYCLLANPTAQLYMNYEFYGYYRQEDCAKADYAFVSKSDKKIGTRADHLLIYDSSGQPTDIGRFEITVVDEKLGSFILKRK